MYAYLNLLKDILDNGENHEDRTGVGTLSVFGRQIRFDLRDGFPLMTTKRVFPGWIWDELEWFLSGGTSVASLYNISKRNGHQPCSIWDEWATEEQCAKFGREPGNLGPIYGALWRRYPIGFAVTEAGAESTHGTVNDQINNLCIDIASNPESRRLIVTGWHPFWQRKVTLPPCHTLWQLKVHNRAEISLHLYARSIDSFLGLPYNIASYAWIVELLAHAFGLKARELIISFGDVHIYKSHLKQVELQLSREPRPLPKLKINHLIKGKGLTTLTSAAWQDMSISDYNPHPSIKAEVAV